MPVEHNGRLYPTHADVADSVQQIVDVVADIVAALRERDAVYVIPAPYEFDVVAHHE